MQTHQKFTGLGLLVLGALMAGSSAQAASVPAFQGKFTLASMTRWDEARLPAGDYTFTVDRIAPGSVVTVFRGTQAVARIQAVGISDVAAGASEIVKQNGAVRQVSLPAMGVSLDFPSPPPIRRAWHEPVLPRLLEFAEARAVQSVEPW